MLERVLEIISRATEVPIEVLNENSSMDNVDNWDSLNQLTIILSLEEEFGITFPDEVLADFKSVKMILDYIQLTCPQ